MASTPMSFDLTLQLSKQESIQASRQRFYSSMKKSAKEIERLDFSRHGLPVHLIEQIAERYVARLNQVIRAFESKGLTLSDLLVHK